MGTKALIEWEEVRGTELPDAFLEFIETHDVFRYCVRWLRAFYKGDIEAPEDFLIITDDGSSYKTNAKFIMWTKRFSVARWSQESLDKAIEEITELGLTLPTRDPNYQT